MPLDASRYTPGLEYYGSVIMQSAMLIGMTTALTYPFDLINTRMATDMTPKGQRRLYDTVFDCFNRTNIDEGLKTGLYKGWQISALQSAFRSVLTLPVIDVVRNSSSKIDGGNQMVREFFEKIGVSFFSSTFMSLLLYPLDTAKRCMQLNGVKGHLTMFNGPLDIFKKFGIAPLYRGVHLYLIREFLTAFAQLTVYDAFRLGTINF